MDQMNHNHRLCWQRAHRDWRFWIGLCLMLAAITMFALRFDLVMIPNRGQQTRSSYSR